jgi:galactokinase
MGSILSVGLRRSDSNVKHALTGGEYASRRAQCEAAVSVLQKVLAKPGIKALRYVSALLCAATLSALLCIRD